MCSLTIECVLLRQVDALDAGIVLVWTSVVHVLFLGLNYALGRALQLEAPLLKSLVMVGRLQPLLRVRVQSLSLCGLVCAMCVCVCCVCVCVRVCVCV